MDSIEILTQAIRDASINSDAIARIIFEIAIDEAINQIKIDLEDAKNRAFSEGYDHGLNYHDSRNTV